MAIGKWLLRLVLFCSMAGILYSLFNLFGYIHEYRAAEKKYEGLQEMYDASKTVELKTINEDYVGWVTVDGTDIHYPVVLGNDNEFYLTHNFYKEEDRVGAIFMDYRNDRDMLGSHTIIYGHNMKDKSMFATLANVLEADFSEKNRIRLEFANASYEWEIFSAYKTRGSEWMQVDFESKDRFKLFVEDLQNVSQRSFSNRNVIENKILTLATCTNDLLDERVVVHAVLAKGDL